MADIKKKLVDGAGLQAAMGIMADFADKGVRGAIGGYNQSFPLTAATKGNIYYHKGTNRYYICVDNYNGSSLTNPNSKFEELSVYTNRQRLNNLIISEKVTDCNKVYPDSYAIIFGVWNNLKLPINAPDNSEGGVLITFNRARKTQLYIGLIGNVFMRINQGNSDESTWAPWIKLS